MTDYFQLFSLPTQFLVDETKLVKNYHTLLAENHPDKFASLSAFEQKQAMMMATTINDAYYILKNPLDRAAYLLKDKGIDADDPTKTQFSEAFLWQQMQWREALDEVDTTDNTALSSLLTEVQAAYRQILDDLNNAFEKEDFIQAASTVGEGRFVQKLQQQINDLI